MPDEEEEKDASFSKHLFFANSTNGEEKINGNQGKATELNPSNLKIASFK